MSKLAIGLLLLTSTGCFHVHGKPQFASAQAAEKIQFPEWSRDATTTLTGPQLKALQIAMDDFSAIGTEPSKNDDPYTRCYLKLETYDAWVRSGEGMTFIHFTPKEDERCGLKPTVVDAGTSYAISADGVILKRE